MENYINGLEKLSIEEFNQNFGYYIYGSSVVLMGLTNLVAVNYICDKLLADLNKRTEVIHDKFGYCIIIK